MAQILAKEAFERATPKDEEIDEVSGEEDLTAQDEDLAAVVAADSELEEGDTVSEDGELTAADDEQELDEETAPEEADESDYLEELPLEEEHEEELSVYADDESEPLEQAALDDDVDELDEEPEEIETELDEDTLWRRRTPKPAAGLGKARSRKTRKQDLESLLEEELIEEEPLPTLFSGDQQQDEVEISEYVADLRMMRAVLPLRDGWMTSRVKFQDESEEDNKQQGKDKKTLKDLADLCWEFDE